VTNQLPSGIIPAKAMEIGLGKNGKAQTMRAHNTAPMTAIRCLSIAAVLFLSSQIPLYAAVSAKKKPSPPKPHKKVTNKTVLDMLKKYQSFKTYQSMWQGELKQGTQEWKLVYKTAYERKSGKTFFVMWSFIKKDDQWVPMGGQSEVYDGANQLVALRKNAGQPMNKKIRAISDPNSFTYRDFRSGLSFVYPIELPLLYPDHALTEYPLMEVLQASLKEIKVTGPGPKNPGKIKLELMADGTCVRMHLAPKTLLINDFAYFRRDTGKTLGPAFELVTCTIDKPIRDGLFDFKTHLKSFEAIKPVEPQKNQR